MSALRQSLADYLSLRRSLGYWLQRPEKLLGQFIDYLDACGASTVTAEHALAWARLPESADPSWWAHRLTVVRGFAGYLHALDEANEVPPTDVLVWKSHRANPFIYADDEITALIAAAATLSSPLRVVTYQTLIGLLASHRHAHRGSDRPGCRRLRRRQRDPAGTAGQGRCHPAAAAAPEHDDGRAPIPAPPRSPSRAPQRRATDFPGRNPVCSTATSSGPSRNCCATAGIQPRSRTCRPRIHDLRHTFAVTALLDAYRDGLDIDRRLTLLATYLGHTSPAGTYWYLSATPQLLAAALDRLDRNRSELQ